MPSPFPGMDPYLEGKEWLSFHIELSSAITRDLIPKLRPKYYARTMPRFVTATTGMVPRHREIYPDVGVSLREPQATWQVGTTAVAPQPIHLKTVMPTALPHYVVEIVAVEQQTLVTSLEVLSPANKHGKGYQQYLDKRERILQSDVHLLEIDWLRQGQRVPMVDALPDAPYFVFLSRAEMRPMVETWPILPASRLPVVPVPLLAGDDDVTLDLQAVFTAVYDALDYGQVTDYSQPPEIPLLGETAVWAAALLREQGVGAKGN